MSRRLADVYWTEYKSWSGVRITNDNIFIVCVVYENDLDNFTSGTARSKAHVAFISNRSRSISKPR